MGEGIKFEVKTYFKITGDFNPDEVTEKLGIVPDEHWKKGDVRYKLKDKVSLYEFSMWKTGLSKTTNEYYVENQMLKTVAALKTKTDVLNKIKEDNDVKFTLQVVPEFYSKKEKPVFALGNEIIDFCSLTHTEIDYDYYFLF